MLAPLVAGVVVLAGIVGGASYFLVGSRPTQAAHLSIVVLPFANLSNDPAQDYFADGVTENLTTDLSRIRDSFVIARNTAFTYKGKNIDAKTIGKELDVRYVLEGSVQRDGTRVRVNAQLIDAETGAHIWADRFEDDVADLFKLQDQVVARLANSVGIELVKAEAAMSLRSKNPDAIDLDMRGRALMFQVAQQPTKEKNIAVRVLFEQALKIDPNDANAVAGEADTYQLERVFGWTTPGIDYEAKILGQADRAIAIDPNNIVAYTTKAYHLLTSRRPNDAVRTADAGLGNNPNYAGLYAVRGSAEISLGRFEQAKSDLQHAMRLSPRDFNTGLWQVMLGDVEMESGHTDIAIVEYQKAFDAGYRAYWLYAALAASYAIDGKMEEAKSALAEALRINPQLTVKWVREHASVRPVRTEGLRKAGLPEE
jgi:adenylate cyclase